MTTPKEFLLSAQTQSRTFHARLLSDYFPDTVLDVQNVPGLEEEQIAVEGGVIELKHVSGRSTWIKDISQIGGDLKEQYLRQLFLSKVKQIEELLLQRGKHKHTIAVRCPGPDPLILKIRDNPAWKILGETLTVVLVLESLPIRITVATANYERVSGHMISTCILVGVR